MKKINIFVLLLALFSAQVLFSERIPDDYDASFHNSTVIIKSYDQNASIPYIPLITYENYLISPDHRSNESGNISSHETQGIANIDGEYWILSKSSWIDTFTVNNEYLFSDSDKVNVIRGGDFKDITFFDGNLYVSRKTELEIYPWNYLEKKFEEKIKTHYIENESFGSAVHRQGKIWFYGAFDDGTGDYIYGQKMLDGKGLRLRGCKDKIFLYDKNGNKINHNELTDYHWTQGMAFSPNGRYFFYVHDDERDENSDYTGIYIYYFDDANFLKFTSDSENCENINAVKVGFINMKYDPDVDGCTDDACTRITELEGIDAGNIGGYDLRILILHNESGTQEHYSVYHFKLKDYDNDDIKDIYDNCPFDWNENQEDWNGDGIGDACDDFDKDGIVDLEDNCIFISNPNQEDWDFDGVGDACDNCPLEQNSDQKDSDFDNIGDACDKCSNNYNPSQADSDGDGIPDACDNCPDHYNPSQADSDGDRIPDACDNCPHHSNPMQEDRDSDGVGDKCDNCPNEGEYNPREINSSEIVVAPCENGIGGAACMLKTKRNTYQDENGDWWWQPDHDLDGKGDTCDPDTVWSKFRDLPTGNSVEENIVSHGSEHQTVLTRMNETLSVNIRMNSTSSTQRTETATTRYCWISEREKNFWGRDGNCTTEEKHNSNCETNFGYSHGTDPEPVNDRGEANWKFIKKKKESKEKDGVAEIVSDEFTEIKIEKNKITGAIKGFREIDWDWRYDFKIDDPLSVGDSLDIAPECQTAPAFGFCSDANVPKFYFTMSTGVHSGDEDADYIVNGNEINPDFFKNRQKYARSSRLTLDPVIISYHKTKVLRPLPPKYCFGSGCGFPDAILHNMIIDNLIYGPRPYEMPGMEHYFKNDYGSDLINTGVSFREWSDDAEGNPTVFEKNRPMNLMTITKNVSGKNVGIVAQNNISQLRNTRNLLNELFEIAEMDVNSNGDWRTKGVLENVPAGFMPTTSIYHNGNLYVVSKNGDEAQIYRINRTNRSVQTASGNSSCHSMQSVFEPIFIGGLQRLSDIILQSVGESLLAVGQSENGMEVYKFSGQGFENITGLSMPQKRDVYNVEVKDGVLYLAGGAKFGEDSVDLKTDIWRFTEAEGWQLIRNDINMFPITLRIDFDGDKIVLTNRAIKYDATTERAVFNADGTGNIMLETIKVEGAPVRKFTENFCLSESENSIFPGITNFYGECRKVENYDFDEITFPDYKFSVAGYKNNLYLGGLTGIRRLEIGEDGEITKKEIVYSGETNNLAVYGNTLYAANYSEIDIFEIADDGKIERKSSIKTNNCKNIRIYGNRLFAAENKRIRIFDLSDPLSPELLKTISLGNKAEDLEIAGNELFVYENLNGLLTRKGKVSVFDIADIENPQKLNDFSQYCNDPEMQKSGNTVYLGCKNGTFKVTGSGLQGINGSKNYLRDSYVFDGILYQVFSGTLHKSAINVNDTEEDGWF